MEINYEFLLYVSMTMLVDKMAKMESTVGDFKKDLDEKVIAKNGSSGDHVMADAGTTVPSPPNADPAKDYDKTRAWVTGFGRRFPRNTMEEHYQKVLLPILPTHLRDIAVFKASDWMPTVYSVKFDTPEQCDLAITAAAKTL